MTRERGFALLYASLVASLLTALGIIMFTIAQKELLLSSVGRDSQFAFYAADAGVECALYWDFRHNAFDPLVAYTDPAYCGSGDGARLKDFPNGPEGTFDGVSGLGGTPKTGFYFEVDNRCVYVTVQKNEVAPGTPATVVESFGYNTSCSQLTHPRRLERAVRATF